jgi:N-acetylglucosamine kinase-like BadF-type ATPase
MANIPLLIGIDGGATKTAGVLITSDGRVVARARARGSAIIGPPGSEACATLSSIVDSLCAQAAIARGDIAWLGLGLNGIDFEDELPMQHAALAAALGISPDRFTLVNDGLVALWGASAAPAACIVHHGSGFTAAYRAEHGGERLFNHLDVARVFDMRSALVSLVERMILGMAPPTPLKEKALAHFGITDERKYCEAVFRRLIPRERQLSSLPLIYQAWLEGDPAAVELVRKAVDDYALAARAMIAKTGRPDADATFGGGVIASAPAQFWPLLAARVHDCYPAATVKLPELPAELGAAIMAGYRIGLDPAKLFEELREADSDR